jgi:two-component system, chemotaxis family, response regulator PixG
LRNLSLIYKSFVQLNSDFILLGYAKVGDGLKRYLKLTMIVSTPASLNLSPPKTAPHFQPDRVLESIVLCSSQHFTGTLVISSPKGLSWRFYYHLGRVVWATGDSHTIRRWRRAILQAIAATPDASPIDLNRIRLRSSDRYESWKYHILCVLVKRNLLTREQVCQIVSAVSQEIFFDLLQHATITPLQSTCYPEQGISECISFLKPEPILGQAKREWHNWCSMNLEHYLPNNAPLLRHPGQLRQRMSYQAYTKLSPLLQGKLTLRDLAIWLKQDVTRLTCSLLPFIEQGTIALVELPDAQMPNITPSTQPKSVATCPDHSELRLSGEELVPGGGTPKRATPCPLIVCIDDSPLNCQLMETVLHEAGYRCLGITDAVQTIPILLEQRPSLVFLDLVMPVINGYEVCAQIHRVSLLKTIPVVMLTSQDGVIDRLRAKTVKADGFLSKPIDADKVLAMVQKFVTVEN